MATRIRTDPDYYRTLGVSPDAGAEEIRRAYRRLALEWHPDRHAGSRTAAARFRTISEAYAVLSDPAKRREYDRARAGGQPWVSGRSQEDLFRDLFADPVASGVFEELARELERLGLRVDRHQFQRTLFGGRAVITGGIFVITPLTPLLALLRVAATALGGATPGQGPRGGPGSTSLPGPAAVLGRLRGVGRWLLGLPSAPSGRPSPAGTSAPMADPSVPVEGVDLVISLRLAAEEAAHGGQRRVTLERDGRREELLVTIPPGTRAGTRLRLRGKGRARAGQPAGDAYLVVHLGES